jgi:hypothetical protein
LILHLSHIFCPSHATSFRQNNTCEEHCRLGTAAVCLLLLPPFYSKLLSCALSQRNLIPVLGIAGDSSIPALTRPRGEISGVTFPAQTRAVPDPVFSMDRGFFLQGQNGQSVNCSPPYSAAVKNEWSYTSNSSCIPSWLAR